MQRRNEGVVEANAGERSGSRPTAKEIMIECEKLLCLTSLLTQRCFSTMEQNACCKKESCIIISHIFIVTYIHLLVLLNGDACLVIATAVGKRVATRDAHALGRTR